MVYQTQDAQATSPREQVQWNIAGAHAKYIALLTQKSTNFYLRGDIGGWYWALTGLRININPDLKDEERAELDVLENSCNKLHMVWDAYKKSIEEGKEKTELKKSKVQFSNYVRLYHIKLMDFLKQLGYFPNKEDRTVLGF